MDKYSDKLNWKSLSMNQILSEKFIEEHEFIVDWNNISTYQILSEPFIEKHRNRVN